jgi:hypothetical protein
VEVVEKNGPALNSVPQYGERMEELPHASKEQMAFGLLGPRLSGVGLANENLWGPTGNIDHTAKDAGVSSVKQCLWDRSCRRATPDFMMSMTTRWKVKAAT